LSIKDKLFNLFRNSFSEELNKFYSGEDTVLTENSLSDGKASLNNTAQFSAIRVLNETIGSIPIMAYQKNKDGREPATDTNIYDIFHEVPNDEMTCQTLKEVGMMALNLGGNAFFLKLKNKTGEIIGLRPIDYSAVTIARNSETKRIEYRVHLDMQTRIFTRDEIFHIPAFSHDGICGLTPVIQCTSAIVLGMQYETYNKNFFKNGAFTSGTVEFPGRMSDDAFERFKKDFSDSYKGLINAGKPIILEEGATFKPLSISQADAQFMESRRFQLEEIARIYRVPLTLLQDFGRATWNNMEQQQLFFIMFSILPWAKRWEENIKTQIMTPQQRKSGLYVEFQLNNLLRGDAKTRAELYASGRQNGWLSINDIRKLENMNPVSDGDAYMQPLNYVNINLADEYLQSQIDKNGTSKETEQNKKTTEELLNMITRKEV